jgi:16S rRNA (uracil1498-N3)-methyltransferase
MNKFFVDESAVGDGTVTITGDDYNHIANVLRMKIGEQIYVSTGSDREYLCEVVAFDEGCVTASIIDVYGSNRELPARITLYQALPKGDKMETIIQKAVELGAYRIIPMSTKRCIVKLDDKKAAGKQKRWQAISEAAAKQSKRGIIPLVEMPLTMKQAIEYCKKEAIDVKLIPYENAKDISFTKNIIEGIEPGESIAVFIGPEGGFSEEEIELCLSNDIQPITLGKRILRTETAGFTAISWLMYHLER